MPQVVPPGRQVFHRMRDTNSVGNRDVFYYVIMRMRRTDRAGIPDRVPRAI